MNENLRGASRIIPNPTLPYRPIFSAPLDPNNPSSAGPDADGSVPGPSTKRSKDTYIPYRFNIIEALSATGLRSIRYAQEIDGCKYVSPRFFTSPKPFPKQASFGTYHSFAPLSPSQLDPRKRPPPYSMHIHHEEYRVQRRSGDSLRVLDGWCFSQRRPCSSRKEPKKV